MVRHPRRRPHSTCTGASRGLPTGPQLAATRRALVHPGAHQKRAGRRGQWVAPRESARSVRPTNARFERHGERYRGELCASMSHGASMMSSAQTTAMAGSRLRCGPLRCVIRRQHAIILSLLRRIRTPHCCCMPTDSDLRAAPKPALWCRRIISVRPHSRRRDRQIIH